MKYESVKIGEAELSMYILLNSVEMNPNRRRPMVLICPGGGYAMCADRESEPVAIRFLSYGFNAAVLRYSCNSKKDPGFQLYPKPQQELADAIAYIRNNCDSLNTNPGMIAVLGFSAGGHLAASVSCLWRQFNGNGRPDATLLCYPVITSGEYGHQGSFDNLCGKDNPDLRNQLSLENCVNDSNPPAFCWHTKADTCVPFQNSVLYKEAMASHGVRCDLKLFETGNHGLSLANREVCNDRYPANDEVAVWPELAKDWLNDVFGTDWY